MGPTRVPVRRFAAQFTAGMPGQTAQRTIQVHALQHKLSELRKSQDTRRDGTTEVVVAKAELLERRSERC